MNDKTEELKEIFQSLTDEETVTESQEETRGSIAGTDERTVDGRIREVIGQMRERYGFDLPLDDDALVDIVKGYYDGASDETVADQLDTDAQTVFNARMSLHLFDDSDADGVDLSTFRTNVDDDTLAVEHDIDPDTIERYRRVARAEEQSRTANDRYRDEFDSLLTDTELSEQLAADVREDGLDDATEGMETDVSF